MNANELKPGVIIKYQGLDFVAFYRVEKVQNDAICFADFEGNKSWEQKDFFASDDFESIYTPA